MTCPVCGVQLKTGARFCASCGANLLHASTGQIGPGRVLAGRYRVARLIARGGMGAVYLADDTRLDDAQVAVKEMSSVYRPGETDAFAQAVNEFRREAVLLARLSHPNLPRVIDRFEEDGKQFLVMEHVPGQTLRHALIARGGRASSSEVRDWAAQLCTVLGYLHAQQPPIIYRDLKPANVMLRPDGRLALIDFGIARFYKPGQAADTAIYGTVGYAAPEQYGEGQTDQRSDIFALGVLLFHALTGYDVASTPFRLPPLRQLCPDLPELLADVLARATAMEPADRFADVGELAAALDNAFAPTGAPTGTQSQAAEPVPAPKRGGLPLWLFAGLLALVLAAAGGLALALPRTGVALPSPATSTRTSAPIAVATAQPPTLPPMSQAPAEPPADMVLVAGGPFSMGVADDARASPAHMVNIEADFFIDRTEVPNQAYRACVAAGACHPPRSVATPAQPHYYDSAEFDRFPAVSVTWDDARSYCAWRGRRLPTEAEWERAARGDDGRLFPWGGNWDPARMQLSGDDRLGELAMVGNFPKNASPYGALDMSGNVWEWTSSRDMVYPYAAGDGREEPTLSGKRIVRGGAWGSNMHNARATTRDSHDPDDTFWNRGFRCAATIGGPTRNDQLAGLPAAPEGMVAVPGGMLRMGTDEAEARRWALDYGWALAVSELPRHSVLLRPFFLDRTEVTNAQYAEFVDATKHAPPVNSFDPAGLNLWQDGQPPDALLQHPVVNVRWSDARAYCSWAGKRLPTEAEWEWAAKGPEGWLWPWGSGFEQARANTRERGLGNTLPAGADLANASWVGALDMGGNAWEWTSSLSLPYPYDITDGRENPDRDGSRAIRGGSWLDPASSAHTSGRNQFDPALANINLGFRCAR